VLAHHTGSGGDHADVSARIRGAGLLSGGAAGRPNQK